MNWISVWVLAVSSFSCTGYSPKAREEAPVLRAWAPLRTMAPSKRTVGEDCSATGARGCDEAACLHVEPHANRGYYCSRVCHLDDDCPDAWGCRVMVPGDAVAYCVPPNGWMAGTPSPRPARAGSFSPPPPPNLPLLSFDGGAR